MKHLLLVLLAMISYSLQKTMAQESILPIDPKVRIGKLDNGLTYYIRKNALPENRADLYFAQKVGSIQEESNQLGLAHFLEHMCFNGTAHFPGNSLEQYLKRIGVSPNASTAMDETVYHMCDVPVDIPGAIDTCLLILHDWSNDLTLDPVEIDKERGVVHEEWRTRMTAMLRFQEQMLPIMYAGSKYGVSLPIGKMDIIMNFEPQTLRDYYEKWYRPDLQAIIVVGDIDVDSIEAQIKKLFADIPAQPNAAKREYFPVYDHKDPIIFIAQDKEKTDIEFVVFNKHDATPDSLKNYSDYLRKDYATQVISRMLEQRLYERSQTAHPPYSSCSVYDGNFFIAKTKKAFTSNITCIEDSIEKGITTLFEEIERVCRFGFTETEYNRTRRSYLQYLESRYNERNNLKNEELTNQYILHFLDNEPIPSIEYKYKILYEIAATTTANMLNDVIHQLITDNNKFIALFAPEKKDLKLPTEEAIRNILKEVKGKELTRYVDDYTNQSLIEDIPQGGKIISEVTDSLFGTTLLTLSNGVKVMVKKTDFRNNQILMKGVSLGGGSLFPDSDIPNINFLGKVITTGLGNFTFSELKRMLEDKQVSVGYSLTELANTVDGNCTPKDFETMLQLTHLLFTSPRRDKLSFNVTKDLCYQELCNQAKDPEIVFKDSINNAVYMGHARRKRLTSQMLDHVDYDRLLEIYHDCFKNAGNFTFVFVGNIDMEQLEPLIVNYLGTLPSTQQKETFKDNQIKRRRGIYKNIFYQKLKVDKASNFISFTGSCPYNLRNITLFDISCQVLNEIYTDKVREQAGATYSIYVGADSDKYPEEISLQIVFDTAPAKREKMIKIIDDEIKHIAEVGPTKESLDKVKKYMLNKRAKDLKDNEYWIIWMDEYLRTGLNPLDNYEAVINSFTTKDVSNFIKTLIEQKNRVEVSMVSQKEDKTE